MTSDWMVALGAASCALTVIGLVISGMIYVSRSVSGAAKTSSDGIDVAKQSAIAQVAALREVHDRDVDALRRDVSALERTTVRKDELREVEMRNTAQLAHVDRRIEDIIGKLSLLPAVQARSEDNGRLLERLLNRLEGKTAP